MGKAKRWFKSLLLGGAKKSSLPSPASIGPNSNTSKPNNKWAQFKSIKTNDHNTSVGSSILEPSSSYLGPYVDALDANKHAIVVAAATAAVAEAALAAAQAAAEVVRLTSGGGTRRCTASAYVSGGRGFDSRRQLAAVQIQSAFRAYLARRALRALKGLVKLQALVRGHIVRKESADMLRRMQAMARIQARACANRAYMSESSHSSSRSSQSQHHALAASQKYDHQLRVCGTKLDGSSALKRFGSKSSIKDNVGLLSSNLNSRWMAESSRTSDQNTTIKNVHIDDEKSDKILEIDTWCPHLNFRQGERAFHTSHNVPAWLRSEPKFSTFDCPPRKSQKSHKPNRSLSSGESLSLKSLKFPREVYQDQADVWTAENTPRVHSASSRPKSSGGRGHFSPGKSECSRSLFGDYLSHPNYMANTESYLAKLRSQSAPRQRLQFERPGSTKRLVCGSCDADTISESDSTVHDNFRRQGYPGRSNRLKTTAQGDAAG